MKHHKTTKKKASPARNPKPIQPHCWPLFKHMEDTHGLTLLQSELQDIIYAAEQCGQGPKLAAHREALKECAYALEEVRRTGCYGPLQQQAARTAAEVMGVSRPRKDYALLNLVTPGTVKLMSPEGVPSIWTRGRTRERFLCAVTGQQIPAKSDAWRPVTGHVRRDRRISDRGVQLLTIAAMQATRFDIDSEDYA